MSSTVELRDRADALSTWRLFLLVAGPLFVLFLLLIFLAPACETNTSGPGIAPEFLERIFDRFSQASSVSRRATAGTGLGLAIVKHLMRLAGGQVRVESEVGSGSTFFLEFPTPLSGPIPFRQAE